MLSRLSNVSSDDLVSFMALSSSESDTHTTSTTSSVTISGSTKRRRIKTKIPRTRPHIRVYPKLFSVLTVISVLIAFFTGYFLAAIQRRTDWFLPYISDGGAFSPEANIFGIFLCSGGFFWVCTVFFVHIRINMHIRSNQHHIIPLFQRLVIYFMDIIGISSGIGVVIVGSVPETINITYHFFGALLAFGGGVLYLWVFVILTMRLKPEYAPRWLSILRLSVVIISTISFITPFTNFIPRYYENGTRIPRPFPTKPGQIQRYPWGSATHSLYLLNTVFEWIIGLCFVFMIFTMTYELNSFSLSTTGLREKYYRHHRETLREIRRQLRGSKKVQSSDD
ncbi:unnamed protein product [Bursaphelenchus xylophilus]|uniref:(pine wood nematode) hypothetical protein n=1 Tax=Bursaphelenchus xylophilus TaxID=6326 RepID=A0A1I7RKH3_BURXY|nr:unnamed protein product [Bursaphelenchus xylophilus]CAG9131324.1 unnamed protein product [Bursaphelenchus xylophilus]